MATDWTAYKQHKQKARSAAMEMFVNFIGGGEVALAKALKQRQMVQGALKFFRPKSAAVKDLKAARNLLLKKAHPDVAGQGSTKATQAINEQWDILKGNVDFLK